MKRDKNGRFARKRKSLLIKSKHAVDTFGKPFIKLCAIGDTHWDEEESKIINYEPTLKFLKHWGPIDVLVLAGDIWDLSFLSHWNSDRFDDVGHAQIAKKLQREANALKKFLKRFIDASGAKRVIYMIGNHEAWLEQYLTKYDRVHTQLDKNKISDWLDFKGLGIEEIPEKENFAIGHMTLCHGDMYGTENPAKRAIERSHRSKFLWHFHRFISWPGYTDADAFEKIQAYAVPGFCHAPSMDYMKKKDNNWSNGFLTAYIKPSGHFTPHIQVVSPNGNFIYDDKEFE